MSQAAPPAGVRGGIAGLRPSQLRLALPLVVLLLLIALSLPFWLLTSQYSIGVAVRVLIFAGLAVAWTLLSGYGGQVSFGHAAFFGLGAYTSTLLMVDFRISPWIGMLAGVVVAVIASVMIGFPSFRLRGIYFSLVTFAFSLILQILFTYLSKLTGGSVGLSLPLLGDRPEYFEFEGLYIYYFIGIALLALTLGATYAFMHSRLGIYLLALRDSHEAAESLGVNTTLVKMSALALSAALCALLGTLYAQYTYFIDPNSAFGVGVSLQIALLAIAGGLGVIWGPALGAVVLIPLAEFLNTTVGGSHAGLQLIIYSAVLILVILVFPRGLAGALREGWAAVRRRQ